MHLNWLVSVRLALCMKITEQMQHSFELTETHWCVCKMVSHTRLCFISVDDFRKKSIRSVVNKALGDVGDGGIKREVLKTQIHQNEREILSWSFFVCFIETSFPVHPHGSEVTATSLYNTQHYRWATEQEVILFHGIFFRKFTMGQCVKPGRI